jgi:hypothetical protein
MSLCADERPSCSRSNSSLPFSLSLIPRKAGAAMSGLRSAGPTAWHCAQYCVTSDRPRSTLESARTGPEQMRSAAAGMQIKPRRCPATGRFHRLQKDESRNELLSGGGLTIDRLLVNLGAVFVDNRYSEVAPFARASQGARIRLRELDRFRHKVELATNLVA